MCEGNHCRRPLGELELVGETRWSMCEGNHCLRPLGELELVGETRWSMCVILIGKDDIKKRISKT